MTNKSLIALGFLAGAVVTAVALITVPHVPIALAEAASEPQIDVWSATEPFPDRSVYYPGTEQLKPDEMRVIALGTGMPTIRPKQAAAAFLVELGNGDKFLFDIGTGSAERAAHRQRGW